MGSRKTNVRRGVAAVELAILLPIPVVLALCSMQTAAMIQVRHSTLFVVDELLQHAIQTGATDTEIQERGALISSEVGLHEVTFQVTRSPLDSIIRIQANVPFAKNYEGSMFMPDKTLAVYRTGYQEYP